MPNCGHSEYVCPLLRADKFPFVGNPHSSNPRFAESRLEMLVTSLGETTWSIQ